jgi:tetraacyldisaccharide-1-P 4'-kinase
LNLAKNFTFEDHYNYKQADLQKIVDFTHLEKIDILVTTHKDAVKIAALESLFKGLLVLKLNIHFKITQGEEEFVKRIISL